MPEGDSTPPVRERVVLALLAALLAVPATYAVLRAYDVLFTSEANPATVIWSMRIAMFWRLGVGAYVAGIVAPLVFAVSRGRVEATLRALGVAVTVVACAIALQGALLP